VDPSRHRALDAGRRSRRRVSIDRAQAEAARQRARAAEDAEIDAFIERERQVLAAMRAELNEIKAELARRRRLAEAKYSPSQPRVPAGNSRGGQWTDRSGGENQGTGTSLARPMGNVDIGDVSGSSELGDLFRIKPVGTRVSGVQLAANDTPDDPTPVRDQQAS
jgi:multidrug efflux pump subunit AcrA (membrane-fusion protein)